MWSSDTAAIKVKTLTLSEEEASLLGEGLSSLFEETLEKLRDSFASRDYPVAEARVEEVKKVISMMTVLTKTSSEVLPMPPVIGATEMEPEKTGDDEDEEGEEEDEEDEEEKDDE